ncbi:MAG: hypothetical protein NC548_53245, partial [Lachnospiraceae bacterium]|nr:hypothetical protein [Lachnospiraceae bacterium]
LYPSHREALAKINQPLQESVDQITEITGVNIIFLKELAQMAAASSKETEWLCESFGLTMDDIIGVTSTGNSIAIAEGANVYVQPITDKSIRARTQSFMRDWANR